MRSIAGGRAVASASESIDIALKIFILETLQYPQKEFAVSGGISVFLPASYGATTIFKRLKGIPF
jgi:hypothetical protein